MSFTNFLKGIFIGIALVIPGLSGSAFAVVTGLYDKIILSVNRLKEDFLESFLFLAPILLGVLVGILLSTKMILYVCITYPLFSYAFFIGLVLGGIPFILKKIPTRTISASTILVFIGGLGLILLLNALDTGNTSENTIAIQQITGVWDVLVLIFAGAFSCSLMSIPGVSGSVLLMVIGQYGTIYNAVSELSVGFIHIFKGDWNGFWAQAQFLWVLLPFLIGAVIGIGLIAKFLAYLLQHHEEKLYTFVIGVMVAASVTLVDKGILANISLLGTGIGMITTLIMCVALVIGGYWLSKGFEGK